MCVMYWVGKVSHLKLLSAGEGDVEEIPTNTWRRKVLEVRERIQYAKPTCIYACGYMQGVTFTSAYVHVLEHFVT